MSTEDTSKEMLKELMRERSPEYLDDYIKQLTDRVQHMRNWIKWLKALRAEKLREQRGISKGSRLDQS